MTSRVVQRAAQRAEHDPFFLGSALAVYRMGQGMDAAALARYLGCTPATLTRLALCQLPVSTNATFTEDVRQIAAWLELDADRLMNVLRYAESVAALRQMRSQSGSSGGTLAAARDREPPEKESPDA